MLNIKRSVLTMTSCAVLTLSLAGCQPDKTESGASSVSHAKTDADLLAGPLPSCAEYITPARQPYRVAAKRDCAAARTFDERMKSVGCMVDQRLGSCKGMTFDMRDADRKAAGTID